MNRHHIIYLILVLIFSFKLFGGDVESILIKDHVRRLKPVEGGIEVTFSRQAAIYSLKNSVPNFTKKKAKLEDAKASKKSVEVLIDPIRLEIQSLKN